MITSPMAMALLVLALFWQGCDRQKAESYKGPPTKVVIGIYRGETTALVYVADQFNYLKQMGLEVELREFDSGVAAVEALQKGRVDIATAADFVFASNLEEHPDLRIIAAINRSDSVYMVARKDKGVSTPSDLKGKRIGVTETSIGDYFLAKYLNAIRIKRDDVTLVNLTPTLMEAEIASGGIDAAISWDPVARRMKERLGPNAISWPAQADSSWHFVLIVHDSFIKKESAALVRLMQALIMAERSIESDPIPVQRTLSKRFGMTEAYLAEVWGDNQFKVLLGRSLMLTLEAESQWMSKAQTGVGRKRPNYLKYMYMDALETARPESVTITH
jgi:NitT/TauT family transport system substrate-binding protein